MAVKHENENSTAAQPPIVIKRHTPVQNCGCDKHVKQATSVLPSGQRVERLKAKGRKFQYQPVDLGERHIIWFCCCCCCCFSLDILGLSEGGKKGPVLPCKLVDVCEESTY